LNDPDDITVFKYSSAQLKVSGLGDFNGVYTSSYFKNGRRAYKHIYGPWSIENDCTYGWVITTPTSYDSFCDSSTASSYPPTNSSGYTIIFNSNDDILQDGDVSISKQRSGKAPSLDSLAATKVIKVGTKEVQKITIVTDNGLLFGDFGV
jgi:hypothetical protein